MTFTYLGSQSELASGKVLEKFGEQVDLPQHEAELYILHEGVALLPASMVSFTKEEQEKYHSIGLHERAPKEFLEKRSAAWQALHEYRESLKAGAARPAAAKEGE